MGSGGGGGETTRVEKNKEDQMKAANYIHIKRN